MLRFKLTLAALVILTALSSGAVASWRTSLWDGTAERCFKYYGHFLNVGRRDNLSHLMIMGVAARESNCGAYDRALELSDNGERAQGMMMILPSTFSDIGEAGDPLDPYVSISAGSKYMNWLRNEKGFHSAEEIIVAYRWGPDRAKQLQESGKLIEYVKRPYVQDVVHAWRVFAQLARRLG